MTKAANRKKKVQSRKGRERVGAPREPNGRRSRTSPDALREGASPIQIVRFRDRMVAQARDPQWGTPLGRLFTESKITSTEFAAGKRWDELAANYRQAISAPSPDPKSCSVSDASRQTADVDPDSEAGMAISLSAQRIVADYEQARKVLRDCGGRVEANVKRLCEGLGEHPAGYESYLDARRGLSELAKLWRLTNSGP